MANTNFKTWLGSDKLSGSSTQQNAYNNITGGGFPVGGQIKAGDFNAALRMTTLVCAGIAAACKFDNLTIDEAEDAIKNAITTKLVTPYSNLLAVLNSGGNDYQVAYASESGTAANATMANKATKAVSAEKDNAGNTITTTYGKFNDAFTASNKLTAPGTYHIRIENHYKTDSGSSTLDRVDFGLIYWYTGETVRSPCFNDGLNNDPDIGFLYSFKIERDGTIGAYHGKTKLSIKNYDEQPSYVVIYYKKIL